MSAISAALERDRRVLFLPTTAMDGSTTKGTLSSMGIRLDLCGTFEGLLHEVAAGAGALLLPEEVVSPARRAALGAISTLNNRGRTSPCCS